MNAIQKFSVFRDWRLALQPGDAVGIIDLLGTPALGTVIHGDSITVKVREVEAGHIHRFRRATGNAVGNCTLFLVPQDTLELTGPTDHEENEQAPAQDASHRPRDAGEE